MRALERVVARISAIIGSVVLLGMMLQITVDIFMRTVIGAGFPATPDVVSRYYMVAISFLPLAMTQIHERHIEATIFTEGLRGSARKVVLGIGLVIAALVFGLLAYGTGAEALKQTAIRAYVEAGTLHFPTWPSYWIVPISAALMLIILLLRLARLIGGDPGRTAPGPLENLIAGNGGTN